ncbi:MAG: hypothetical protein QG671_2674 [Actinomycetota bacterium]|jgi:hypothetical protein|nr:hypothetical protein [Actinomycetota bacterium]
MDGDIVRTTDLRPGRKRVIALAGLCLIPVALTGCGGNSTSSQSTPVSSANTSAAASGTESPRAQAWVRGTHVTLTNSTGKAVKVGTAAGQGDFAPQTTESGIAPGASVQVTDDWSSSEGTDVLIRVVYANDDTLEMKVANPAIGTPYIQWRKGYSVYNWSASKGDVGNSSFDENTTQNLTMEGHQVTATRSGDDGDNKNWSLTLNS